MKKPTLTIIIFLFLIVNIKAQTTDDLLNVLIQKNVVSQKEADSLRAEAAIAAQSNLAKVKTFPLTTGKKIQLSGYTQLRYQALEQTGKIDGFDIRRARLDLKGAISPYWGYRIQFDLAGSPKLVDAYAEFKLNDYLNITVGQLTIPFSLENNTSSSKFELIDFAQAVDALAARGKDVLGNQNGHDLGIQLGGTVLKLKDRPVIDYRLGIFNGAGANVVDNNENKDYAARLIVHPIKGLDISAALYDGTRYVGAVTEKDGTVTPEKNVTRDRYGFDLSYDLNNLSIRGEYLRGNDDSKEREGYYVWAGYYFLQKKVQVVAKYDFYDTDRAKADDASIWLVLGANYNFNATTRLQFNYTVKQEEGTAVDNNFASIQLQIGF